MNCANALIVVIAVITIVNVTLAGIMIADVLLERRDQHRSKR